jgi:competence ComEA-like helix-hairpin-helix protein
MVATNSPVRQEAAPAADRSLGFGVAVCLCAAAAIVLVAGVLGRANKGSLPSRHERINPNTASASSLIRLPGIGWSKARAIVAYRQGVLATTGTSIAFRRPDDLMQVRGVGPKIVEAINEWLDFNEPRGGPEPPVD